MDKLSLPGSLPGLLRKGSPTVDGWVVVAVVPRCEDYDTLLAQPDRSEHPPIRLAADHAENLLLDLTDPTGFDHAVRWLGEHLGLPRCEAPPELLQIGEWWGLTVPGRGLKSCAPASVLFTIEGSPRFTQMAQIDIPSLSLQMTPTAALQVICLHVANMRGFYSAWRKK